MWFLKNFRYMYCFNEESFFFYFNLGILYNCVLFGVWMWYKYIYFYIKNIFYCVLGNDNVYIIEWDEIRIVFFGRMGNGKSVIGNIILGKKVFKFLVFGLFIIKNCLYELELWFGYNIVVVDILGIFDIMFINKYI